MKRTDWTHDPDLRSWVDSANAPGSDFPIQNLPFCVFVSRGASDAPRPGVGIGDRVLDLSVLASSGLLEGLDRSLVEACNERTLNALMSLGQTLARELRWRLCELLREDVSERQRALLERALVPQTDANLLLPARIGNYTDFYASIEHATNLGSMLRPDNPLLPNYKWIPIGYHGRASSVVVSGTEVMRPRGQTRDADAPAPTFGATRRLDYELEIGAYVGAGNQLGTAIPIDHADEHLFGLCLLNDWSARDMQAWEYQPLGPFLAKSFATSVSPWVVTLDALAPFRAPSRERDADDPRPLPYLTPTDPSDSGFAITLEVYLSTARMRVAAIPPVRLSRCSFGRMYWSVAQLLTHHASNGCNLQPGDLLGSGTISGASPDERGSLMELTWRGAQPIRLPSDEERRFLEDGDEIIMRGFCESQGARRIGFGECRGVIVSAV